MKNKHSLVWFRRDLRTFDHAALHHALSTSEQVSCVFVYDRAILDALARADRRVAFIHASVAELDADLRRLGGNLIVRHAHAQDEIVHLAAELEVDAVFANRDYEPQAIARDAAVATALAAQGRRWIDAKDQLIFEKSEVLAQSGQSFSVFTPYKNAWLRRLAAMPESLAAFDIAPIAHRLRAPAVQTDPAPGAHANTLPSQDALGFQAVDLDILGIATGMSGGAALFDDFIARIGDYGVARDFPARAGTSQLSLHLRFGTVSIRHLVRTVERMMAHGAGGAGASVWLSELIWREFYAMILFHHPRVVDAAFKPAYDTIAWESGPAADADFAAWCEGRTGYPLVDAAMTQLLRSGQMHNRLRMVCASFLVKDLGIDWRRGEHHFARHLNDYDLASNNGGWQWAASSGCDAQPYFRIFNPVTQSEKFDASGDYIRQQLPQLAALAAPDIHAPWRVPAMLQTVRIGVDYPAPIVQHEAARARTLARYAVVKSG